jgi:hypothetical protein
LERESLIIAGPRLGRYPEEWDVITGLDMTMCAINTKRVLEIEHGHNFN